MPFALRRPPPRIAAWSLAILGLGLAVGIALWWVAAFGGDAFFHLARVRKLVDFDSISLRSLDEYKDGGLHPGYAFPLWHGAARARLQARRRRPDRRSCCTGRPC